MAKKIEQFFKSCEEIWGVIPGYVKVVIYAFLTAVITSFINDGAIDWRTALIAVAVNVGIYQGPRIIGTETRKLL